MGEKYVCVVGEIEVVVIVIFEYYLFRGVGDILFKIISG